MSEGAARAPARVRRWASLAGVALLIAGCASAPIRQPQRRFAPVSTWAERQAELQGVQRFSLDGRIGFVSPKESWTAGVRWRRDGSRYHLSLSGPLGQTMLELDGMPGRVVLRTAKGRVYTAEDADQLTRETTGWALPIEGLRYWILGVTDPRMAYSALVTGHSGEPLGFEQAGWRLRFLRYRRADGLAMPALVSARGARVRVRLAITAWRFPAP